jgi:hypothetical protein
VIIGQGSNYQGRVNNLDSATQEEGGTLQPLQNVEQQNMNNRLDILEELVEYAGDPIQRINPETTLRIGFININGVLSSSGDPKTKGYLTQ